MDKTLYCAKCEENREFQFAKRSETYDVRGEAVLARSANVGM